MDSPPLSQRSEPKSRTKSASRLSRIRHYDAENVPQISLDIVPSSPRISTPSPSSTISPRPPYTLPLHELLLLSPSPLKRSKTRLQERLEVMVDEPVVEPSLGKRRCKSRNYATGYAASPRNHRRSRRRSEQEAREDRDFVPGEENVKPRKKRNNGRSKKDKLSLVPVLPSPKTNEDGDNSNVDRIAEFVYDLVMWKDVAKSSLWFGFGSLFFLSTCFAKGVNFSIFSFISQLGLLCLGVSFFSNSIRQREMDDNKREFKLKDEDILRVGKVIIPGANLVISKARQIFSGEPAMTLKVVPFLLIGAEYGHLITLWRLCALGFFVSFTGPKLYSSYSAQLYSKVEYVKSWVLEAWRACSHKKIVAASIVTAFWNLSSIRTRIFAAFLCLVILRYRRQHLDVKIEEEEIVEVKHEADDQPQNQQALVAVEAEPQK